MERGAEKLDGVYPQEKKGEEVMRQRSGRELNLMSLSELATVVNDSNEMGPERAKAASCLQARVNEVGGAGWLFEANREGIYKALKFDTSEHVFRGL